MATQWYYRPGEEEFGPVSSSQLRELIESQIVQPQTPIKRGLNGKWHKAQSLRIFNQLGQDLSASEGGTTDHKLLLAFAAILITVAVIVFSIALIFWSIESRDLATLNDSDEDVKEESSVIAETKVEGSLEPVAANGPRIVTWDELFPESTSGMSEEPLSPSAAYEKAIKSVVIINAFRDGKILSLGSGFIMGDSSGAQSLIVTNEHVIRGSSTLRITNHDNVSATIEDVLCASVSLDIAILPTPSEFAQIPLRQAKRTPRVGDTVFALGSPMGLRFTFTAGSVSQFREFQGASMIQTDVNLSGGSSGGPLINEWAEVIGVNTLASRAEAGANNLNFAISIDEVVQLLLQQKDAPPKKLVQLDGYKEWGNRQEVIASSEKRRQEEIEARHREERETDRWLRERDKRARMEKARAESKKWHEEFDRKIEARKAKIRQTKEKWGQLRLGMKLWEAEMLLGPPDEKHLYDALGKLVLDYKFDFTFVEGHVEIKEYQGVTSWDAPRFPD